MKASKALSCSSITYLSSNETNVVAKRRNNPEQAEQPKNNPEQAGTTHKRKKLRCCVLSTNPEHLPSSARTVII